MMHFVHGRHYGFVNISVEWIFIFYTNHYYYSFFFLMYLIPEHRLNHCGRPQCIQFIYIMLHGNSNLYLKHSYVYHIICMCIM